MTVKEKKEIKKPFCCSDCKKEFEELGYKNYKEEDICPSCSNSYFVCESCEKIIHNSNKTEDDNGNDICEDCFNDNYTSCSNCGSVVHNDNSHNHEDEFYCESCYEEFEHDEDDSSNFRTRHYHDGTKYTVANKRFYSAEIECYYPDIKTMCKVYDKMNDDFGVSGDGSLDSQGVEFQTPKLSGETGKEELKKLCTLLEDNKFKVDKTCGLHIHLDVSDFMDIQKDFLEDYGNDDEETEEYDKNFNKIKALMIFYLNFESVLLSYLPRSRRKNKYCFPLIENYHEKEIKNLKVLEDLEQMWYREGTKEVIDRRKSQKYDNSRYSGINFHSMLSNNHLEIRYHSGTINSNKILKWSQLHVYILNAIYKETIKYEQLEDIKYITELSEKQEVMFSLLGLPTDVEDYFKERQAKFSGNDVDNE